MPPVGELERRGLHLKEGDQLDEKQLASWVRHAAAIRGLLAELNPASQKPCRNLALAVGGPMLGSPELIDEGRDGGGTDGEGLGIVFRELSSAG